MPDQCRRETPPSPQEEQGSGEDVVEEELWEKQDAEDETVTAC